MLVQVLFLTFCEIVLADITLYKNKTNAFAGEQGYVLYTNGSVISFINGSSWDYLSAMVACSELGFLGVASFMNSDLLITDNDALKDVSPAIIDSLSCSGIEDKISGCSLSFGSTTNSSKVYLNIAVVSCTGLVPVRLSGGSGPFEGRVEVLYDNAWGSVCDDFWGKPDADVVCNQLGYNGSLSSTGDTVQNGAVENIWIDNTKCVGNERNLMLCKKNGFGNHDCSHQEDVTIICQFPTRCYILPHIANGNATSLEVEADTVVWFRCSDGYILVGHDHISCDSYGQWNHDVPKCILNSLIPEDQEKLITEMHTTIEQECDFVNGEASLCSKLYASNGTIMNSTEHTVGTSVSFLCIKGYEMIGNEIINCVKVGVSCRWNGQPPRCYKKREQYVGPLISTRNEDVRGNRNIVVLLSVVGCTAGIITMIIVIIVTLWIFIRKKKRKISKQLNNLTTPLVESENGE